MSKISRKVRDDVKSGRDRTLRLAVEGLAKNFEETGLSAVLGPDVILVPVPGSALQVEGGFWGPKWIAEGLVSAGLGREVLPCLVRRTPVPKSAFQAPGERPDAQRHFDTIEVSELPLVGERITLVDDFVTKGNTLLGAASRLATVLSSARPAAFALVRTMGLQPDVERIVDPCVGTIRRFGSSADRQP
jgi:predicted amidophosphoribosyltransferase